jgi:type I restriction enzyme S subunit
MPEPIDIPPADLKTVQEILKRHVPEYEVRAFGSRVTWMAKEYSDLDLTIMTDKPLPISRMADLREAFTESSLSIKVDLVDWAAIGESFRKIIEKGYVVVQTKSEKPSFTKSDVKNEWRSSTWGEEISLEYGKSLRNYDVPNGKYRVFGSNGPVGWTDKALAQGPGIILGRKGAYRGVQYSPDPFFVIDTAYYVVPKKEYDMRWLYYAIQHYKLGEIDDGSPIPSTTRAAVYMTDLEVPPVPQQHAAAQILGALDDKIELNRKTNETLETMARALFKSWFVDFDPVRAKSEGRNTGLPKEISDFFPFEFENSKLGKIPKGWMQRSVYDCAKFINGAAFRDKAFSSDKLGLPIIKIGELKEGVTNQTKFTVLEMPLKYRIQPGDILFSWSGSPDTSIDTFVWAECEGWLNQHIFKVEVNNLEEKLFVHYLLRHLKPIFIEIARDKQTTGLGHVTIQDLKRLITIYPPPSVLKAFSRITEPNFKKSYANQIESNVLKKNRNSLLPKLISGEIKIRDFENESKVLLK